MTDIFVSNFLSLKHGFLPCVLFLCHVSFPAVWFMYFSFQFSLNYIFAIINGLTLHCIIYLDSLYRIIRLLMSIYYFILKCLFISPCNGCGGEYSNTHATERRWRSEVNSQEAGLPCHSVGARDFSQAVRVRTVPLPANPVTSFLRITLASYYFTTFYFSLQ